MKKKDIQERAVRVNITLPPSVLEGLDKNVGRLQAYLIRHGALESEVHKAVNRSALIKEIVETLGTERGYHSILAGFSVALGVHDYEQCELFPEDEN